LGSERIFPALQHHLGICDGEAAVNGPFPSLVCKIIAALKLHQTCHSAFAQHFQAAVGSIQDFAGIKV